MVIQLRGQSLKRFLRELDDVVTVKCGSATNLSRHGPKGAAFCSRNPRGAKTKYKYSETNCWSHICCDLDYKHKLYEVFAMEVDDRVAPHEDLILIPGLSVVAL